LGDYKSSSAFSPLERSFLDDENWFQSLRILERNPELVTEDFCRRLAIAAQASEDEDETHLLAESAEVVSRAVAVGVEQAAEEKLGKGGVLAGQAREMRDSYYASGDPQELLQTVDQFVLALMCDDDPLFFDHGRTLQGFGATLLDLSDVLPDPIVNHVGCLALLAATTAHFAAVPRRLEVTWTDRLARLTSGIRDHLGRVESFPLGADETRLYESLSRACDLMDEAVAQRPEGIFGLLDAALPVLSVALACSRVPLRPPRTTPPRDPQLDHSAGVWAEVVVQWIERYGSDCIRALIASPLANPFDPTSPEERAAKAPGRRFDSGPADDLRASAGDPPRAPEAISPPRAVLALLTSAVLVYATTPDDARGHVELAWKMLDEVGDDYGAAGSPLHSRATLATLVAGADAYVRPAADDVERFRRVRDAWPIGWLEDVVAVVEPAIAGISDSAGTPVTAGVEAAVHAGACLRDPVSLVAAIATDLRLPDGPRYMAIRDRLTASLFGGSEGYGFHVDEDAPGLSEMHELLGRFATDLAGIAGADRDKLCEWLGTTYEAGRVTFADTAGELTLLINLSWLELQVGSPNALRWASRARRLALDEGAVMDAATADINVASLSIDMLGLFPSWDLDFEHAYGRLLLLASGLGHAAEALRIATVALDLPDPDDRFYAASIGYGDVRGLLERLLFEARDPALLTEYLLNARGMWFLLDLYDDAGARRPVVSWRHRSWIAQSLPVDAALDLDSYGTAAEVDLADVLAPDGVPQAFWFSSMLADDAGTLASVAVAPPDAFGVTYAEYPTALRAEQTSCLEAAAELGGLLPERIWEVADTLRQVGLRSTLFVSPDPGLPPLAMGLWRNPGDGPARVLADAFDVVYCPTLAPRVGTVPWVDGPGAAAPCAFVVCDPLGDLPEARAVPSLARAVCGNARAAVAPPANRETVLATIDACALADGVFVYQGHSESGAIDRPDAACLLLEPHGPSASVAEPLTVRQLLDGVRRSSSGRMPRRAAFLSCGSGVAGERYDATGLAMAALAAGSDAVVSTLRPVSEAAPWTTIADEMVDALRAAQPWEAFGSWQRRMASTLEQTASEEARWAIAGVAMFGGPYV
jgi:hypothetical protein